MKTMRWSLAALILAAVGTAWAEPAPKAVVDYVNGTLLKLGTDPVVVSAVKAQNARKASLDSVKAQDATWKATAGITEYMKAIMDNDCASLLRSWQDRTGFIAEAFVMDNLGANVAMTDKTSDYWQGDEPKFQRSYAEGKGAVFIDEVDFDDSSQTYVVQASFPVRDGEAVIGAITVGIDIDLFLAKAGG